jgi:secreted protein with Ig-like and vWFA domain
MNMKHFVTLLVAVMATMTMVQAEILKKVQVGNLYYNLDTENRTAEIAAPVDIKLKELTIPTSVTYENVPYSVTGIGETAFYRCTALSQLSFRKVFCI